MSSLVAVTIAEGIATLRLDRVAKRNALDGELMAAIGAALDGIRDDAGVRVVVIAGNGYELGAAWAKVSRNDRGYLSVSIDDPALPAPIYARLIPSETAGQHDLLWSRARRAD